MRPTVGSPIMLPLAIFGVWYGEELSKTSWWCSGISVAVSVCTVCICVVTVCVGDGPRVIILVLSSSLRQRIFSFLTLEPESRPLGGVSWTSLFHIHMVFPSLWLWILARDWLPSVTLRADDSFSLYLCFLICEAIWQKSPKNDDYLRPRRPGRLRPF